MNCIQSLASAYSWIDHLQTNGLNLSQYPIQSEVMCLIAVEQNGLALKDVINQTELIIDLAVRQNGLALQYARYQTFPICLAAVMQNGLALQYVYYQDIILCQAAVSQTPYARKHVALELLEYIPMVGDVDTCCVCLENCDTKTLCYHPLCLECYLQLQEKFCPICKYYLDMGIEKY